MKHLPLDIIQIILLNLPVKSLQRFKTVCKPWNVIISDRKFAKNHHQKSKIYKTQNLFLGRQSSSHEELCLFEFDNRTEQVKAVLQQPLHGDVLCFGDGLVLLSNTSSKKNVYVLWNPSSRRKTEFSCPYRFVNNHKTIFGLCHDPELDDYKVVIRDNKQYVVFSWKNKTWLKKQEFDKKSALGSNGGLLVGGFSFWLLYDKYFLKNIVYFDPRDDKFKELQKPKPVVWTEPFRLTSLGSSLCSYSCTRAGFCGIGLQIWIMEGHVDLCSWSELLNIQIVEANYPFNIISPMFFTKENARLVIMGQFGNFVFYSPQARTFEYLKIPGSRVYCAFPKIPYFDTLFFPDSELHKAEEKGSIFPDSELHKDEEKGIGMLPASYQVD